MQTENRGAGLDEAEEPRAAPRRLRQIVRTLSDPAVQRELAAHSPHLAQRAAAIAGGECGDPAVARLNIEFYRSLLAGDIADGERGAIAGLLTEAEQALDGQHAMRELARWCRAFAERAASPALWEARLRTADDLDAEADRIERHRIQVFPDRPNPGDGK